MLSSFPRSLLHTQSIDIPFKLTTVRRVFYDRNVMEMHAGGIAVKDITQLHFCIVESKKENECMMHHCFVHKEERERESF